MANVYVERDRRGGLREPPSRAMSSRTTSTAFSAVSLPNRTQLGPGQELHTAVIEARGHAKAVELYLMQPLRPRRRLFDQLG